MQHTVQYYPWSAYQARLPSTLLALAAGSASWITGDIRQDSGVPAKRPLLFFQIIRIFENESPYPSRSPFLWCQVLLGMVVLLGKLPSL